MGTLEDRFNSTDAFYYQFNGGGERGPAVAPSSVIVS